MVFLAAVGAFCSDGGHLLVRFCDRCQLFCSGSTVWLLPTDLSRINRAFFDFNAYVSIGYLLTTVADVFLITGSGTGR